MINILIVVISVVLGTAVAVVLFVNDKGKPTRW